MICQAQGMATLLPVPLGYHLGTWEVSSKLGIGYQNILQQVSHG